MLRTHTESKIIGKIAQAKKIHTPQDHKSALDHPQKEHQVTTPKTLTITSILRKNLRLNNLSGYYHTNNNKISPGNPSSNKTYNRSYTENIAPSQEETYGKNHKEYNASIKVNTKNEFLYTKETATQEITPPGPKNRTTLYNAILHIARKFLETRENIKILTHSFYHINLG